MSDKSKIRRRKFNDVNIRVAFIVWLAEFVNSIVAMFGPTLFAHEQVAASFGSAITMDMYFVVLPFLYLVNDTDVKNTITDDGWFRAIRGIFNRTNVQVLPK